ncbi:MAG: hypothetical protein LBB81_05625 [Treponema sp.]|jgi:hypothetical protein|nr:hypothetical protein [Treponema sp.]
MGRIKSALEIALERTENVQSDKSSIKQFDAKQNGKKLANAWLEGSVNLADEIKKTPAEQQKSLKQGIFDVLITQIALPAVKDDEKRLDVIGKGLHIVINSGKITALFAQLKEVFAQYLQEVSHYEQALRAQYAPKLRQKEEELSRRLGREVRIDPFQDPEFAAFYNQNMNTLKANYETVIEQVKEETRRMFTRA